MDFVPAPGEDHSSQPSRRGEEVPEEFSPRRYLPTCHAPWQDPGWRWQRVTYLQDHGRRPHAQLDDDLTWAAWSFRRALNRSGGQVDQEQLARDFPAHVEAYQIHSAGGLKCWEVEARLLGAQDDKEIGARCGLSPAGVACFHSVFFDCRQHLGALNYVLDVLIGPKAYHGLRPADHELLLKLVGYSLGGLAVDRMLDYLLDPPTLPSSLDGFDDPMLSKIHEKLHTHALVMALTMPADVRAISQWKRMQLLLQALQGRMEASHGRVAPAPLFA